MPDNLSDFNFKKKGWTKEKLVAVADEYRVDLGSARTFHQIKLVLITAQKKLSQNNQNSENDKLEDDVESSCSTTSTDSRSPVNEKAITQHHEDSTKHNTSSTSPSATLLPFVEITKTSRGSSQETQSQESSQVQTTRMIKIKTSVFEDCRSMCDNIGIPNSDNVALNFLCQRALPPDYHDKNDDDQSKAINAASRAMGVLSGEPYFPEDVDVMNRVLAVTKCGEYMICEHPDFPDNLVSAQTMSEQEGKKHDDVTKLAARSGEEVHEIRVLWLKLPIFQSKFSPYRNEKIEFAIDSNSSKVLMDVDRTIRSLIFAHNTFGLNKRNDKMNAFYLLNSNGDVVVLNYGLLKCCPLKNNSVNENQTNLHDPLYLCLHDAIPGENPKPAILRNRELKHVFPIPEICKCLFLLLLVLLCRLVTAPVASEALKFSNELDTLQWPNIIRDFTSHRRGLMTILNTIYFLQRRELVTKGLLIWNSCCNAIFSSLFTKIGYTISVDFSLPLLYILVGYGMMLVMRLRSKFCIFNLTWWGMNRYWYILDLYSVRNLFKNRRKQLFSNHNNKLDIEAVIRIRYEEKNSVRFLVIWWIPTKNYEEDYEVWSSTLRAALGIPTASQNDPDMLVSDPHRPCVHMTLSASFLKHEMYDKNLILQITKPGRTCRGYIKYFQSPYIFLASLLWIWFDFVVPCLNAPNAVCFTSFIKSAVDFFWRNTLSAVIIDLADIEREYWPLKFGYSLYLPSIFATFIGIMLW